MAWTAAQEARIYGLAEAQHGVLTRAQLLEAGCSARTIARRLKEGLWRPLRPSVYRLLGSRSSDWHQQLMAACLWLGPNAFASHGAAARLHKLDGMDDEHPVEVSVNARHDGNAPEGVQVHRVRLIPDGNVTKVDGIPVTTVNRTLLDVAGGWPEDGADAALDCAIRKRKASVKGLRIFLAKVEARGRRGLRTLKGLLDERTGDKAKDSDQERRFLKEVVRAFGLPDPEHNFVVKNQQGEFVAQVDFGWPEYALAVELFSKAHHTGAKVVKHDNERQNRMVRAGYTPLIFWYEDLQLAPEKIAGMIADQIADATSRRD